MVGLNQTFITEFNCYEPIHDQAMSFQDWKYIQAKDYAKCVTFKLV